MALPNGSVTVFHDGRVFQISPNQLDAAWKLFLKENGNSGDGEDETRALEKVRDNLGLPPTLSIVDVDMIIRES